MLARNYFGVGFLRGLNSVAEVFSSYSSEHECSLLGEMRSDRLLRMAEKEQSHRIEDAKRGQYLGWSLAAGAVIAAALVSLCRGPWQVSVALVGIPVLGAVQALIQGRKEKGGRRGVRWF
jgi:hypothetical protein